MPISNNLKKILVAIYSFAAVYIFNISPANLFGLQLKDFPSVATLVVNTALLTLATYIGHDGLQQLQGGA